MVSLKGYTKQQKFGLLTLATRKTWEHFEVDLLYNHSSLESTNVVVTGYGFDLTLWRDTGNPLCDYLIKRDSSGFITLVLTTYKRGDKTKAFQKVHYIKTLSDCEKVATALTELELNTLIKVLQSVLADHVVWRGKFEEILTQLISETPKVPRFSKRNLQGSSLNKEVNGAFIRLSELFKGFQRYQKKGLVHRTDITYGLILSNQELTLELFDKEHSLFLGFRITPSSSQDAYEFTLWHVNLPKPIVFQDVSIFQEYAELLAVSLTSDLSKRFLLGLEECLIACGLWSVYNRSGIDLY